ncbi:uncharacterized protein MYCGRDRAFT_94837 [Zymoseptoria tritici IPO323]|uniref:F-box domain-containing protein n=1 Tax=Zymoseptoria tritici (strain CBS 115943 / IPO323) TaxID=336722 RepID=F9XFG4_ZYMTI|nr:uncharacterized protein MYCGRDRAFT_94837 [Zymoseptoria tritici IPO323]EGP85903.1 hypothetical protein MYCGRDRAFT_94837 [Zymoseptoria tritici IPO323]
MNMSSATVDGTVSSTPGQYAAAETTLSAAARFFEIYEMTEEVLQYLDPAQIMRTQGIMRKFREVIGSSPVVREAAFLREHKVPNNIIWEVGYKNRRPKEIKSFSSATSDWNPNVPKHLGRYCDTAGRPRAYNFEDGFFRYAVHEINPAVLSSLSAHLPGTGLCSCPKEMLAKNASCLEMFLCDPPVKTAVVLYRRPQRTSFDPGERPIFRDMDEEGGIKLYYDTSMMAHFETTLALRPPSPANSTATTKQDAMAQSPNAAARFFGIYELVEEVLQYLAPAQIARTQRVSRTFQDVLKRSHRVRQIAFLEWTGKQDVSIWQINYQYHQATSIEVHDSPPNGYDSQQDFLNHRFTPPPGHNLFSILSSCFFRLPTFRPNPSLLQSDAHLMSTNMLCGCPSCAVPTPTARQIVPFTLNLRCRNALDKNSSCLNMFICDPPVCAIGVKYLRYSPTNRPSNKTRFMMLNIFKSSGITVRDILEPMRKEHSGYFVESIWLHEGRFVSAESQEQVRSWEQGTKCRTVMKMEEEKERMLQK